LPWFDAFKDVSFGALQHDTVTPLQIASPLKQCFADDFA
jgi:hypothetical protein